MEWEGGAPAARGRRSSAGEVLRRQVRRHVVGPVCRRLLRDENRDVSAAVLVAGAPRSGTTWLAELLESGLHGRLMFEPFQPHLVPGFAGLAPFLYMRPEERSDALYEGWLQVFDGSVRNAWVDKNLTTARPRCRIVKTVRSSLMLAWIRRSFPAVPVVFLLRHPCAVVVSRMHYGWSAEEDLAALLRQERLVEDHLAPHLDRIHGARTTEERHAILWCISVLVPLRQLGHDALRPLYYEHLYVDQAALPRVLASSIGRDVGAPRVAPGRPSRTTTPLSPIVRGGNNLTHWQSALSADAVRRILDLVAAFGLDDLYGAGPMPARPAPVAESAVAR